MTSTAMPYSEVEKSAELIKGEPFRGLRMLFRGFCNPKKLDDEEGKTAAMHLAEQEERNSPLTSTKVSRCFPTEVAERHIRREGEMAYSSQIASKSNQSCVLPKSRTSQDGTKLRTRRSKEVFAFAFLAVIITICSLHKLGFSLDFSVIASPETANRKNFISIGKKSDFDAKARKSLERLQHLVAEIKSANRSTLASSPGR
eukprot:scaffold1352_cov144-Cylindrotheca_fusiformis.AAC.3